MQKNKLFLGMLAAMLTFGLVLMGCGNDDDGDKDNRKTLVAGTAVSASDTATRASVTFTGATGLNLTAADFAVSGGTVIEDATVSGDTATVDVTFAVNTTDADKTYTVSIEAGSMLIKGDAKVAITQAKAGTSPAVVEAEIASVVATNGTISIVLVADPITAPTAANFLPAIKSYIGADTTGTAVTPTWVSYTAASKTVAYTFTAIAQTAAVQSVVIGAKLGAAAEVKASAFTVAAAGSAQDTVITIAAIPGVTAPATSAAPVAAITETDQYTGTVTWAPTATNFAASTAYTATITLTAKSGYTLTGVTENFFTVADAATVTNSANSGVVTAVFPQTSGTGTGATDTRATLVADQAVEAAATDTSASVTFTGATGVTGLSEADFTVDGGWFTSASVSSDTATVVVGFDANSINAAKTITVAVSGSSGLIKGGASVAITQAAGGGAPAPSVSATPIAATTTVAKTSATQKTVDFTLTSANTGTWKVYEVATGGSALKTVSAAFASPKLTLTASDTDLTAGDYYVSVTETNKTESLRLKLTVAPDSGSVGASITPPTSPTDSSIVITPDGTAKTLTIEGEYSDIRWYVNGQEWTGTGTGTKKITLTGAYSGRTYEVRVVATIGGNIESGLTTITIN
jgi:hypothetical protein